MRPVENKLLIVLLLAGVGGCPSWPDVEVEEPASAYTDEAGDSVQIAVTLSRQPAHAIDVWAVSSDAQEARASGPIQFRHSNWDQPHGFTITGVDDLDCDGDRPYGVAIYARWHDDPSGGYLVDEIYLINRDDDCRDASADAGRDE